MIRISHTKKTARHRLFHWCFWPLLISLLTALLLLRTAFQEPVAYRISTGSELGVYYSLGKTLSSSTDKIGIHLEAQTSKGSIENASRIEAGQCDFAIIQNDTPSKPSIRSIAVVYEEILHLIVRSNSEIKCLTDLAGKKISVGSESGGTHSVAKSLLDFVISDDLPKPHLEFLDTSSSVKAIEDGSIDAAFCVTGLRSQALLEALGKGHLTLIPLSPSRQSTDQDVDNLIQGFMTVYPYMQFAKIPMRTYGDCPAAPVPTLSISAVLVCGKNTSPSVVQDVTSLLFENKADFATAVPLLAGLDELKAQRNLQFPLHTGADYHYRRREPTFLHENAEAMGFILTVILLFGSSLKGIASWRKRESKDHIDRYFQRIADIEMKAKREGFPENAETLIDELHKLELQAFQDLIEERLSANDSYLIFLSMIKRANDSLQAELEKSATIN